jgi:DMSO/TMAO reductase YedYZ molybdopterin-dependent catalytic subunit
VAGVDGVLVYALDGGPLPESQGGPYRLLAPKGSTCANVKGVVRLRVTPPLAG